MTQKSNSGYLKEVPVLDSAMSFPDVRLAHILHLKNISTSYVDSRRIVNEGTIVGDYYLYFLVIILGGVKYSQKFSDFFISSTNAIVLPLSDELLSTMDWDLGLLYNSYPTKSEAASSYSSDQRNFVDKIDSFLNTLYSGSDMLIMTGSVPPAYVITENHQFPLRAPFTFYNNRGTCERTSIYRACKKLRRYIRSLDRVFPGFSNEGFDFDTGLSSKCIDHNNDIVFCNRELDQKVGKISEKKKIKNYWEALNEHRSKISLRLKE